MPEINSRSTLLKMLHCGALFSLCAAASHAASLAFALNGTNNFGHIDLGTGIYTSISSEANALAGLGVNYGVLYAESYTTGDVLYSVNTSNGNLSTVGSSAAGVTLYTFGSTLTGLYGVGCAGSGGSGCSLNLYSVNPSNGAFVNIGSTGLVWYNTIGLSTNSSTLYLVNELVNNTGTLYTLSLSGGAANAVGNMGSVGIDGLMYTGTNLIGSNDDPNPSVLENINASTGTVSTDVTANVQNIYALAPDPLPAGVPEPATWAFLASGLATLRILHRSRSE